MVVIGFKRWFDELFDGYLLEESMWDLQFLVGRRKSLRLHGGKRENFIVFTGCMNSTHEQYHKKERRKKGKRTHKVQYAEILKNTQYFYLSLFKYIDHNYIYKDSFLY